MDIKLDEQMMHGLVSEALLKTLDEEKRNMLIVGAIKHLLTPVEGHGYGGSKQPSPLQFAFQNAVRVTAERLTLERLSSDSELKEKINGLLTEALAQVMETNREKTVNAIAEAITKGMAYKEDRY